MKCFRGSNFTIFFGKMETAEVQRDLSVFCRTFPGTGQVIMISPSKAYIGETEKYWAKMSWSKYLSDTAAPATQEKEIRYKEF